MSQLKPNGPLMRAQLTVASAQALDARCQYGALCYRTGGKEGCEVLLITSRDTGRWVIPKGWPIAGLSPALSAAREAWEEAGVKGKPAEAALGAYAYAKRMARGGAQPCVVEVFALEVSKLSNDFPEKGQRRRKWVRPEKAAQRVDEPELAAILVAFAKTHPG